jgi:serine phosphatase RsbU (regulator of sigma subunit)
MMFVFLASNSRNLIGEMISRFTYSFFFLLLTCGISAQSLDSLWALFNDKKNPDSIRFAAHNEIVWAYMYSNPDTAFILAEEEVKLAQKHRLKNWEAKALNAVGATYQIRGDFPRAIDSYQNSLRIREMMHDKQGISSALTNIGSIYISLDDFDKAEEYELKALALFEELNNKAGIASVTNNLGIIYGNFAQFEKSLEYAAKSLKMYKELGDKEGILATTANIGETYTSLKKYDIALEYLLASLKMADEQGNVPRAVGIRNDIGRAYQVQKKFDLAIKYFQESKEMAAEIDDYEAIRSAASVLHLIYKQLNNPSKALENHELYVRMRDSLEKAATEKEIMRKEMQFIYGRKAEEDSLKNLEERKVQNALILAKNAQIEQDRTQKLALIGGLCLLVISGGIMYNRYRLISQQKKIIEHKNKETEEQKIVIEEKQKEILSSISYAKRLQEAILPPKNLITEHLPKSFILYQPKDIVAGDFYWFHPLNEDEILIAAADCTGHGVPGAMVSVVCSNAMNRTVKEFNISDPGKILDKTRDLVVETFERSESEVKDGMDISLISLKPDKESRKATIKWAGANNPLWLVKDGKLVEIMPSKQAIGRVDNPAPYTTHAFELNSGDMIYIFTDGYADQFGGPQGKKFKYNKLNELVLDIHHLHVREQQNRLEIAFFEWKGKLEQVDDVCIIGICV